MEFHDSLPYIDADISATQREAANLLIRRELPAQHSSTLHPSIAEPASSYLTPILQQAIDGAASGTPSSNGIDLTRYQSSDELSAESDVDLVKSALATAYANIAYLQGRQTNIALLEEYGKNAWLISNSHLDDIQKRLDAELAVTKEQSENINRMRKTTQEDSKGELMSLDSTWKEAIGKIVETQLATDALKQELVKNDNLTAI